MNTSLIQFGTEANAIITTNQKTGSTSVRLLTAREFRDKHGIKGQEARRQYHGYLRGQGQVNTAGLAAAMTSGELLVKGFQRSKNGMRVGFVFASSIVDKAPKQHDTVVSREDAIKALGLTEEQAAALGL